MAGAGELNDSDYSCGSRPRHVRLTLSKPTLRYTSRLGHTFPRNSTNYDGGPAFFSDVPIVRRPIDNYTRTLYATRSHRVLSSVARLVLEGVTRIPRRSRNRSYSRVFLVVASNLLLRRFRGGFRCEVSAFLKTTKVLDCVSGSRFIRFFLCFTLELFVDNSQFNTLGYPIKVICYSFLNTAGFL